MEHKAHTIYSCQSYFSCMYIDNLEGLVQKRAVCSCLGMFMLPLMATDSKAIKAVSGICSIFFQREGVASLSYANVPNPGSITWLACEGGAKS
eukprot:1141997-Pelagomonas_calceolata.AAC.4